MIFFQIGSSAVVGGASQHFKKIRELSSGRDVLFFCDFTTTKQHNLNQINVFIPVSRLSRRNLIYYIGGVINCFIVAGIIITGHFFDKKNQSIWLHAKDLFVFRFLNYFLKEKRIILDVRDMKNLPTPNDLRFIEFGLYCSEGIKNGLERLGVTSYPLDVFFDRKSYLKDLEISRKRRFVITHGIDDGKNSDEIYQFMRKFPDESFVLEVFGRIRSNIPRDLVNDSRLRLRGVQTRPDFLEYARLENTFLLLLGQSDGLPRSVVEWLASGGYVISNQQIEEFDCIDRFVWVESLEEVHQISRDLCAMSHVGLHRHEKIEKILSSKDFETQFEHIMFMCER